MATSLSLFPQNTIFLALYAWNEARLRIDDRVRAVLRDNLLSPLHDCITSRLFAIRHELRHGNMHSVRSAFENAVASPSCQGSAGLWRLFVLWCGRRQRGEAREVLYRGMRACPWAKGLMMAAFGEVRGGMGEEVRGVYRVMQEKELRIHVDLDDWVEERET
jgi:hypothetical protein